MTLLGKNFKLLFGFEKDKKERRENLLFRVLFVALALTLEIFLFRGVLSKVTSFEGASNSFLILFLFAISIFLFVLSLLASEKLLFQKQDRKVLSTLPIRKEEIVFSDVLFLLLLQVAYDALTAYPLLLTFGVLTHKLPFFYFQSLFYSLFAALTEVGAALLLTIPYHQIKTWLRRIPWLGFLFSLALLFLLSFLYSSVLHLFLELVNQNELITLFSTDSLAKLSSITSSFYPTSFFLRFLLYNEGWSFVFSLLLSLVIFFLGVLFASLSYRITAEETPAKRKTIRAKKPLKPWEALWRKECSLLFLSSENFFSFSGLLFVAPFFSYLLLKAMNSVFRSGLVSYYTALFPTFFESLDLCLLLLIYVTLLSGGDNYIGIEKGSLKIMKILPLSPSLQLWIKLAIPYLSCLISLLVTIIVLTSTKELGPLTGVLSFFTGAFFLAISSLASLREELKRKPEQERNRLLSSLYDWVLPILLFFLSLLLSFYHVPLYGIVLLSSGVLLLSSLPFLIHFRKRIRNLFLKMEVRS